MKKNKQSNKLLGLFIMLFITGSAFGQKGKLAQGVTAFNSQEYVKAAELLAQASTHEKTMNDPKVWVYHALAVGQAKFNGFDQLYQVDMSFDDALMSALKAKDLGAAEKYGEQLSKAFEIIQGGINNEGVAAYQEGNYAQAIAFFDKKSEVNEKIDPNLVDTNLIVLKAVSYQQMDDMDNATLHYQELAEIDYDDPNVYNFLLSAYTDVDDAKYLMTLKKAQQLYPDNSNYTLLELDYYITNGKMEEKLAELEAAAEANPENLALNLNIASVYDQQENFMVARNWYSKALEIDAENKRALFGVGATYFNEAVEIQSEIDYLRYDETAKEAELKKKRDALVDKSFPYFEKVLAIDGEYPEVLKALTEYYKIKGNMAKSQEYEAKYLAVR